jgi:hypothetical protein
MEAIIDADGRSQTFVTAEAGKIIVAIATITGSAAASYTPDQAAFLIRALAAARVEIIRKGRKNSAPGS